MGEHTRNSRGASEGFVLITALMVIFLVMSIVVMVTLVTSADMRSAAVARAAVQSRITAESVSDSIFASIAQINGKTLVSDIINQANSNFAIGNGLPTDDNNPLNKSIGVSPSFGQWFYLKPDGGLAKCSNDYRKEVCFKSLLKSTTSGSAIEIQQKTLELMVITRGACVITGEEDNDVTRCVYRVFRQDFATRAYIKAALMTQTITGDIPGTKINGTEIPVAYLGTDAVTGSIFTNDNDFAYCGDLSSLGGTNQKFENSSGNFKSASSFLSSLPLGAVDFCNPPAPATLPSISNVANEFLPSQITNEGKRDDSASQTIFKNLAGSGSFSGDQTIDLSSIAYPSNGVIYVDGNLNIQGTYNKKLTIYATGNISITGDIKYKNGTSEFDGETGSIPPDYVLLGLATPKDIILKCSAAASGPCENRHVVAVLNASITNGNIGGHVFNDRWNNSPIGSNPSPPVFTLYGAIVSYWHPVFGAYRSNPVGVITNGWKKNLKQDKRLIDNQPPYFFRTTQASIVRSTFDSLSCTGAGVSADCN